MTSYMGVVLGYAGSFGYDGASQSDWGRWQVVTTLSVRRTSVGLEKSPTFGYYVGIMKDETLIIGPNSGHSP